MGHAGLSSLLVLMLPLLLTSLQATTAARVPAQNTAEDAPDIRLPNLEDIEGALCSLLSGDQETASIIKAKFRESPDFTPFEDVLQDDINLKNWQDDHCDDSEGDKTSTTTDTTPTSIEDSTPTSTEDSTPTSTEEDSTPTSEDFTSTSEDSTSAYSSTETSTASSSSEAPPLSLLELYTKTEDELDQIDTILDSFIALVDSQPEAVHVESMASARHVWGGRDLPMAWWQRRKSSRPRAGTYDFCTIGNNICSDLELQLEATDELVAKLTEDVEAWQDSDLTDLTEQRVLLQETYDQAEKDDSGFVEDVDDTKFTAAVGSVKENVESGSSAVQERINDLTPETNNSGSVALVATLGSVGGLMVLSLIGVTIYGAVQKSKAKKKLSPAKAKQENIPIDAYAHDGPGSRPPPKMDPYSPAPVPAPRNYNHHSGQYDPRREPVYPEPISGRPQQGLRRTNY